jgi:serine/threonine protein kinase/serine/threonine protein phosphatase PrpC
MRDIRSIYQIPFHRWVGAQTHLSCERLLGMLTPVVNHLRMLHAGGFAHGGITPESLLVSNETQQVDLGYFVARRSDYIVRGTDYSPPEADLDPPSQPSASADIYSLAAVLYHALNGQSPGSAAARVKSGEQLAFSSRHVTQAEQSALCLALALNAAQRPTSIDELETLLRRTGDQALQTASSMPFTSYAPKTDKPLVPAELSAPKTVDRVPINLTKGKVCQIAVSSLFLNWDAAWQVSFCKLEDLGLHLDATQQNIVGIPLVDGEHSIHFQLFHTNGLPDRPRLERSIKVTINPDPTSIWKNLPSDRADPYWKEDTDSFALTTPAAFIVAASVRGRSHAQEALFRDDDFRISYDAAAGWHFVAVADGAGSAKLSRRGSLLACTSALKHLKEQLRTEAEEQSRPSIAKQAANNALSEEQARSLAYSWLGGAAHAALKAIIDEAAAQEPPRMPKEYATTLLLSAAKQTEQGWIILSFGIGDGGIGLLKLDDSVQVMSTPDSGEFSSETIFLTSKNLWMTTEGISQRLHVALVPGFHALVLMTDGITDPLFPTEVSFGEIDAWQALWTDIWKQARLTPDNEQASCELLQWSGFYSKGNHDDRTIVLLLPHETERSKA